MDLMVLLDSLQTVNRKGDLKLASDELFIELTTLKKRIKKLERYFNTQIIVTDKKNVILTPEGEMILNSYKRIKKILLRMEIDLQLHEDQVIATSEDIFVVSHLSDSKQQECILSKDIDSLIADFNNFEYNTLVLDEFLAERINYKSKQLFETCEIRVVSTNLTRESFAIEDILKSKIVVNEFDTFGQIIEMYLEHLCDSHQMKKEYEIVKVASFQNAYSELLLDKEKIYIMSNAILIPDGLKSKFNFSKFTGQKSKRILYKYNH